METINHTFGESDFRKATGWEGYLSLFFSDSYKEYVTYRHHNQKKFSIVYSEEYAIPVLIRQYWIFVYAELLSSPIRYKHQNGSQKEFLDSVCKYLKRKLHVQWIMSTPVHSVFDDYPTHAKVIRFADTEVDLTKTEEEIFSNFNQKFRNAIRHAEKCELAYKIGGKELIDDFIKIESATWKRSGVTVDHSNDTYYNDLFKYLPNNIVVIVTYDKEGQPAAGLVRLYDTQCAYGILSAHANRTERGTVNYTHWQLIKWIKNKGVSKYIIAGYRLKVDAGSKIESIQQFKDGFNGYHREGFMFRQTFSKPYQKLYVAVTKALVFMRTGRISKHVPDMIEQEIHKWPEYND